MEYFKKIFKESIAIVVVSSIIGIVSGTILSTNIEIFYALPIILLVLPALNSLIGDISTVSISRLTTHLYIGTIPPKIQKSDRLKRDFLGLIITLLLSLIALLILGYTIASITGIVLINPFIIFFILIITVIFIFVMMFIFLFISAIFVFKRGKDPNNFLIPFITSLADLLTPVVLLFFIKIFI